MHTESGRVQVSEFHTLRIQDTETAHACHCIHVFGPRVADVREGRCRIEGIARIRPEDIDVPNDEMGSSVVNVNRSRDASLYRPPFNDIWVAERSAPGHDSIRRCEVRIAHDDDWRVGRAGERVGGRRGGRWFKRAL